MNQSVNFKLNRRVSIIPAVISFSDGVVIAVLVIELFETGINNVLWGLL